MSSLEMSDIKIAGSSLFADEESYLDEVTDEELGDINGGFTPVVFLTASSPECAAFAGGLIAGGAGGVGITKAFG